MSRRINYEAINEKTAQNLKYIDDELIKAGYGYFQRLAILGNVQRESGGNPLAISPNGTWHGIIQWNKDRYRLQSKDAQSELQRQTALLLKELEKKGWSGQTWQDQLNYAQSFKDASNLNQAVDIFTRRFVRPGNIDSEINKRLNFAQNGWIEEPSVDLEVVKKVLPDNLIQARRNVENKVINHTKSKSVLKPNSNNQVKTNSVPSVEEIQSLIYNSFKYQQGGLIYHEFNPEKYKSKSEYSSEESDDSLVFEESDTFPVNSVSSWRISDFDWSWKNTQSEKEGKVEYKSDTDLGNMEELVELMRDEGISFRITSGNRPGSKTSNGSMSHHSSGNAIDITPIEGQSWDDLINQMRKSKRFISYMREHKLGILDERSKKMQAKTGATGAHFHIGPDIAALSNFNLMFR